MLENRYDLIVIGQGPAGRAAAMHAARLGKKVLAVEKDMPGGTCLNRGCIPTKALEAGAKALKVLKNSEVLGVDASLEGFDYVRARLRMLQMLERFRSGADFSLKKSGAEYLKGFASVMEPGRVRVESADGGPKEFLAAKILIACGAAPRGLPGLPFSEKVLDSSAALALERLPKSAVIVGAGAIGCEFAHIWSAMGVHIDLVEMCGNILPGMDDDCGKAVARHFAKRGIVLHTSCVARAADENEKTIGVNIESPKGDLQLRAEYALVGAGVTADLDGLFASALPELDERGFIKTDKLFETSLKGLYAAGDIIGRPWLAHAASAQGISAADAMFGNYSKRYDILNVPSCAFCGLEAASVGLTEKAAKERGVAYKSVKLPMSANAKAQQDADTEGFVKLLCCASGGRLLGASMAGEGAGELVNICALALSAGLGAADLSGAIFAHPTLSEILGDAAAELEYQILAE